VAQTGAKLIHLQDVSPDFGPKEIIWKQKQHSEARGALLARGRIWGLPAIAKTFFREMLIFALFIPYMNVLSLVLIIGYGFFYTGRVFLEEYRNPRIFVLPFFNIYLLLLGVIFSLKGFIYGKQRI
jgi:hypothetical protein